MESQTGPPDCRWPKKRVGLRVLAKPDCLAIGYFRAGWQKGSNFLIQIIFMLDMHRKAKLLA